MNFTSLRYFLEVAAEGSVTKAAQKLYISQQSLSEHIARLESEYGVKLFERTPRLHLTYAGFRLQKLAEQVLSLDVQIQNELSDIANEHKGTLSVGITPTHGRILMPWIWEEFHRRFPGTELHITVKNSQDLIALLRSRNIDISCSFISKISSLQFEPVGIIKERFCVVASQKIFATYLGISDPSAGGVLDPRILNDCPFLMAARGSRLRNLADLYLGQVGIQPVIALETSDLEMNARFCGHGFGAFFCNELFANYIIRSYVHEQTLFPILIDGFQEDLDYSICYHRDQYLSDAARAFIDITKKVATQLTLPTTRSAVLRFDNLEI